MNGRTLVAELRAIPVAYAQVVFSGDARLGAVLIGLTLLRPAAGAMGLVAVATAHAVSVLLGYRADLRHAGAHGFNAALLGLLLAAGRDFDPVLAVVVALGGAASVVVALVLGERLQSTGLPVLVLPFVLLAWLLLPAVPAAGPAPLPAILPALELPWPLRDAAHGLAAVYCQTGEIAGLVVCAVLLASTRHGALAAAVGIAAAMATGSLVGVEPGTRLATALVYNGAFTGIALGAALLVPGRAALLLAASGSAIAALACAGLAPTLSRLQLPVLSAPFVLVTLATLRALRLRTRIRAPFAPPLPACGPEANFEFVQNMARRFGPPGVPEFALPLGPLPSGEWIVSQGVAGEHTHRGPWECAWDFEVVDERGFPFAGAGERKEQYFGFGAPVVAPGAGTVAAVHDGVPDGEPGTVDAVRPWGNAVVLRHGPELYSVLAHLRCGSIRVRPDQHVALGDELAACGASGRSPRPHLHFQVQGKPDLGASALPARCVHYQVRRGDEVGFVAFGTPAEGERIAPAPPAPAGGLLAALAPGAQLQFALEPPGGVLRLQSEISLLGERSLRDLDRGDRLFFVANTHELVFTTHDGPATAPLRALLLALPRMCWLEGTAWRWRDAPPAAAVLGTPARWLRVLIRPLVDPFRPLAELRARRHGDHILVESTSGVAGSRNRFLGRVELDQHGLLHLELVATAAPARVFTLRRSPTAAASPVPHSDPRLLQVHP